MTKLTEGKLKASLKMKLKEKLIWKCKIITTLETQK